jgi:hypothetical protein
MAKLASIAVIFLVVAAAAAHADTRSIKCSSVSSYHDPRELMVETTSETVRVQLSMNGGAPDPSNRELVYYSPAGMNAPQGSNTQFFVVSDTYELSKGKSQIFIAVDWAASTASMAFVNMVGLLSVDDKFVCRRLD